jgi:hypothetical protein
MNKRSEATPRLVGGSANKEAGEKQATEAKNAWIQPICTCGAVIVASIAAVKLAQQPDGADKLRGFAGVLGAAAAVSKVT